MILLNKIDIVDVDRNKIDELYNSINYDLLGSKHFLVKDISALKNIRLEESIKWLFNAMMDHVKDEGFDEEANSYINLV